MSWQFTWPSFSMFTCMFHLLSDVAFFVYLLFLCMAMCVRDSVSTFTWVCINLLIKDSLFVHPANVLSSVVNAVNI